MKITYDSAVDAVNIIFKKGKVFKTLEIAKEMFLDLDKNGKPLYLEIIGAREKFGKELNTATFENFSFNNVFTGDKRVMTFN